MSKLTRNEALCYCASNINIWNVFSADKVVVEGWYWKLYKGELLLVDTLNSYSIINSRDWLSAIDSDICKPMTDSESVFK